MLMDLMRPIDWVGAGEDPTPPLRLHAGELRMEFQAGRLLNIARANQTVVSEIYFALRDHNWGTVPCRIENLRVNETADGFELAFCAAHDSGGICFSWSGCIRGGADSTVIFSFEGIAQSDFLRNRIGFCVLHPAGCRGLPCSVEHTDGALERGRFPEWIAPHQPFLSMRSICYPCKGGEVSILFEGDTFEMEDQRNWTDASFKTYCTPLNDPFPVQVRAGERFAQTVSVAVHRAERESHFSLGSCLTTVLTKRELRLIGELELGHLRCDIRFDSPEDRMREILSQVLVPNVPIQPAVFFTSNWRGELAQLKRMLAGLELSGVLVFDETGGTPPEEVLRAVRELGVPVGSGTDAFFTQLNRQRPARAAMDFVSYSNTPQVHAFDNGSILATVEGQRDNITSCQALYPGLPVQVSPVTLKMRRNPDSTRAVERRPGTAPGDVDTRQTSLFAAAWMLRSIAVCLEQGIAGGAWLELVGEKGVMEAERTWRDYPFPSVAGMRYPVYYTFWALRGLQYWSAQPALLDGWTEIRLERGRRRRRILANATQETRTVSVTGLPEYARMLLLDEESVPELALWDGPVESSPLWSILGGRKEMTLKRYATLLVEFECES